MAIEIDDGGGPIRAKRAAVQKTRHRGNHVLVEYGQVIQSLPVQGGRVTVFAWICSDSGGIFINGDLLIERFYRENDSQPARRSRADRNFGAIALETLFMRTNFVTSRLKSVEAKSARGIGCCCAQFRAALQQVDFGTKKGGPRLVLNDSADHEIDLSLRQQI